MFQVVLAINQISCAKRSQKYRKQIAGGDLITIDTREVIF